MFCERNSRLPDRPSFLICLTSPKGVGVRCPLPVAARISPPPCIWCFAELFYLIDSELFPRFNLTPEGQSVAYLWRVVAPPPAHGASSGAPSRFRSPSIVGANLKELKLAELRGEAPNPDLVRPSRGASQHQQPTDGVDRRRSSGGGPLAVPGVAAPSRWGARAAPPPPQPQSPPPIPDSAVAASDAGGVGGRARAGTGVTIAPGGGGGGGPPRGSLAGRRRSSGDIAPQNDPKAGAPPQPDHVPSRVLFAFNLPPVDVSPLPARRDAQAIANANANATPISGGLASGRDSPFTTPYTNRRKHTSSSSDLNGETPRDKSTTAAVANAAIAAAARAAGVTSVVSNQVGGSVVMSGAVGSPPVGGGRRHSSSESGVATIDLGGSPPPPPIGSSGTQRRALQINASGSAPPTLGDDGVARRLEFQSQRQ